MIWISRKGNYMKETLLLYHVADDVQKDIKNIAEQLHIQIQYLD